MLNNLRRLGWALSAAIALTVSACMPGPGETDYDVIIRGGNIYDGLGNDPFVADLGISGDRIAAIGNLSGYSGAIDIDAENLAVAPGFINMLSWATESLIVDGRGLSDIKQGVTLEVMGEGRSMGPLNETMKAEMRERQTNLRYEIEWTTLGEYLEFLENKGVSPNVASYVGATTIRVHELGYEDRPPNAEELARMQQLVRQAMREGALGVGSSLIYAPANFADTDELIALVAAAAESGGGYISHIRSEGNRLEEGVQELIKIASLTGAPAEIYHLKAAGKDNFHKLGNVFELIEAARAAGLQITADMYNYTAGSTGLYATMPLWVQEGGHDAWIARLKDPDIRARVVEEMKQPASDWENFYLGAGPENILLVGFKNERLRPLTGKTLQEVADERNADPADTAIDLVIEDDSRVDAVYFFMSEDNVRKKLQKSWISFGSDAGAVASEAPFTDVNPHPRAYGNFSRLLGKYVREEKLISLQEAIRRLTSLPAFNIGISERGELTEGYFADIVVFDPERITDNATFEEPHQYATGVLHVFVNGEQVLRNGRHTGATPGRVVRGLGWEGWGVSSAGDARP
ncbi:MAG: D-aminoacylase [Woeseiaceae bacterium]|nr:D-aminoacylase [Woeseiaceae bacterium]